jgi:peptide deformylase
MVATLKDAEGLGLAAVQIGELVRMFILDLEALKVGTGIQAFINPIIQTEGGVVEYEEGCLSIPEIYQRVERPAQVHTTAMGLDGKLFEVKASGMYARAIQHEYDHLEGKMFIDLLSPFSRSLLRGKLKRLAEGLSNKEDE